MPSDRPGRFRPFLARVLLLVLLVPVGAALVVPHTGAGDGIVRFAAEKSTAVPLAQISPWLPRAVVAIEDERFYQHGAVDPRGLARALVSNLTSGPVQGGSTLTQQFVKNVLLEQARESHDMAAQRAATARTLSRKLRELTLAIAVEQRLSKDQILAGYLDIVYFGQGRYGVGPASERYFGVPPADLTLPQSALLAGLVQAPSAYDPVRHPALARSRRNTVQTAMFGQGRITRTQLAEARAAPLLP